MQCISVSRHVPHPTPRLVFVAVDLKKKKNMFPCFSSLPCTSLRPTSLADSPLLLGDCCPTIHSSPFLQQSTASFTVVIYKIPSIPSTGCVLFSQESTTTHVSTYVVMYVYLHVLLYIPPTPTPPPSLFVLYTSLGNNTIHYLETRKPLCNSSPLSHGNSEMAPTCSSKYCTTYRGLQRFVRQYWLYKWCNIR